LRVANFRESRTFEVRNTDFPYRTWGTEPSVPDDEVLSVLSDETARTIPEESASLPEGEIVLGIMPRFAKRVERP
jgi:hypothetical protein